MNPSPKSRPGFQTRRRKNPWAQTTITRRSAPPVSGTRWATTRHFLCGTLYGIAVCQCPAATDEFFDPAPGDAGVQYGWPQATRRLRTTIAVGSKPARRAVSNSVVPAVGAIISPSLGFAGPFTLGPRGDRRDRKDARSLPDHRKAWRRRHLYPVGRLHTRKSDPSHHT